MTPNNPFVLQGEPAIAGFFYADHWRDRWMIKRLIDPGEVKLHDISGCFPCAV
jgi:hypothetical protein